MIRISLFGLLPLLVLASCDEPPPEVLDSDEIRLQPGFHIEPWAEVPGARSLLVADDGATVYVGTRDHRVYAVLDHDLDRTVDEVKVFADELEVPNGLALTDDGDGLCADLGDGRLGGDVG